MASARAQLDALDALLAEDRKNLALVNTAFAAGSVTRVDILSAQSQLANDGTLLPPLSQQLSVARHALSITAPAAPRQIGSRPNSSLRTCNCRRICR